MSESRSNNENETKVDPASGSKPESKADAAAPEGAAGATGAEATKIRRSSKRTVASGRVCVLSTFNNTVISATDGQGNVVAWSSAGARGFRGARKNTPFAAQVAAEAVAQQVVSMGMKSVQVFVSGPGAGRESALRAMASSGLRVTSIKDVTPIPHNGCRPPKRRRV